MADSMKYVSTIEKLGIEIGIQEGIRQVNKEVVLRMLQKGVSIENISDFTGLSLSEIAEIEQNKS